MANASGIDLIAAERARQISVEGWSPASDVDRYLSNNTLPQAAACYALPWDAVVRKPSIDFSMDLIGRNQASDVGLVRWPWDPKYYKRTDRIGDLVKAGALIAAALDVELAREAEFVLANLESPVLSSSDRGAV